MTTRKILGLLFFWTLSMGMARAQSLLTFHPYYGKAPLQLSDSAFQSNDKDSITISLFRFYISGIELWNDGKRVWEEKNYHLINTADTSTLQISLSNSYTINCNKIKLNLGIDSTTNVSGAMGGDLDPMKGMYWAWQSGYINVKLEGASPLCRTRNNGFEFHLGGYHVPFNALQTIELPIKSSDKIEVFIDLKQLLTNIDLSKTNQLMSPSKEAVELSGKLSKVFEIR